MDNNETTAMLTEAVVFLLELYAQTCRHFAKVAVTTIEQRQRTSDLTF